MRKKLLGIFAVSAVVFSVAVLTLPVGADQPFMTAARNDCNKALGFFRRASADKGGHKANAISLTNRAIAEINAGIEYDRNHESDFDENEFFASDQPNMVKAKDWLKSARENLEKATADKGGHRAAALKLVNDAIDEAQRGIDYDRNH